MPHTSPKMKHLALTLLGVALAISSWMAWAALRRGSIAIRLSPAAGKGRRFTFPALAAASSIALFAGVQHFAPHQPGSFSLTATGRTYLTPTPNGNWLATPQSVAALLSSLAPTPAQSAHANRLLDLGLAILKENDDRLTASTIPQLLSPHTLITGVPSPEVLDDFLAQARLPVAGEIGEAGLGGDGEESAGEGHQVGREKRSFRPAGYGHRRQEQVGITGWMPDPLIINKKGGPEFRGEGRSLPACG